MSAEETGLAKVASTTGVDDVEDKSTANTGNTDSTAVNETRASAMGDSENGAISGRDDKTVTRGGTEEGISERQKDWDSGKNVGVFSGWGFDVNSVTSNMNISNLFTTGDSVGGLFASPDSMGGFFGPSDSADRPSEADVDTGDAINKESEKEGDVITGDGKRIETKAAGFANVATAELEHASRAAQATIGKAAEEIGRGWGTLNTFLDDMLAPDAQRSDSRPDESQDIHATFRKLFPHLDTDDEVVDHYRCTLIQKYRCFLNNATPEKVFPLRGRLFVTMSNIAMYVTDDGGMFGGNAFGINIPFQEVNKIQKGSKAMLRVLTKTQTSFIFAEFESDTHYNGALSLLEQLGAAAAGNVGLNVSGADAAGAGGTSEKSEGKEADAAS